MRKFFSQKNNINLFSASVQGKRKNLSGGFTLIETLVAISIFTMSVLTLIVILSQGLSATYYAKQKMIAGYLAQEGIEYTRNMRDSYILASTSGSGWNSFYTKLTTVVASCQNQDGCYFNGANLFTIGPLACYSETCSNAPLFYDSTTGEYGYDESKTDSGFTRQIKISQISNGEIKVTSTVYWTQGSGSHNVSFTENLFNWIE